MASPQPNLALDLSEILDLRRLVASEDLFFAATGISGGAFLRGVDFTALAR